MAWYGIDWDGPAPFVQWDGLIDGDPPVEIPEVPDNLIHNDYEQLLDTVDPLRQSNDNGVDLFIATKNFVLRSVAKAAVMQVMQCMTKNFPKNV